MVDREQPMSFEQEFIEEAVANGSFADRDAAMAYFAQLLDFEHEDAISGVKKGLEDAAAGRGRPVDEAFAEIRRSLRLPSGEVFDQ